MARSAGSKIASIVVWSNSVETMCMWKRLAGLVVEGTSSQRASSGKGDGCKIADAKE